MVFSMVTLLSFSTSASIIIVASWKSAAVCNWSGSANSTPCLANTLTMSPNLKPPLVRASKHSFTASANASCNDQSSPKAMLSLISPKAVITLWRILGMEVSIRTASGLLSNALPMSMFSKNSRPTALSFSCPRTPSTISANCACGITPERCKSYTAPRLASASP